MRPAWIALACLLGFLPGSQAADVSTSLTVSVEVLPHVRLEPLQAIHPVTVTAADVERGYLDVAQHYRVHTNAPGRVLLQVHPRVGLARAVDIEGFGAPMRLLDSSLEFAPEAASDFDLRFRLWLAPGVAPGDYPLPLQLAAAVR